MSNIFYFFFAYFVVLYKAANIYFNKRNFVYFVIQYVK